MLTSFYRCGESWVKAYVHPDRIFFFFSIKKMSNDAGCERGPSGKDVCVPIADSLCCAEETNTTL